MALIARGAEEIGEAHRIGHRLVVGAVEGDGLELAGTLDGELCRGAAFASSGLNDGSGRHKVAPWRAAQGMVVVVLLAPLRRLRGRHALRKLGAQAVCHAAEQRAEFELPHEGGQRLGVGLVHGSFGKGHVEGDVAVERDERPRQPRLIGEMNEALAPLLLLDLRGAGKQRVEIAELVDEEGGGLHPDPRHARHVVAGIADQRLHLDDLRRRHAEALHDLRLADRLVLHGVVHDDAGADDLHQVLVRGDDGHVGAGVQRLHGVGGDQIVGLVALLFDAGDVEGAHGVAHERELGDEVAGRLGPVRLVAVEQIAPEGARGIV